MSVIKRLILMMYPLFFDLSEEVVITTPEGDEIVLRYIRPVREPNHGIKLAILADQKFMVSRRRPSDTDRQQAKERDARAVNQGKPWRELPR